LLELVKEGDGAVTFEEALALTAGNKMNTEPLKPPLKSDRRTEKSELTLGNLPLREPTGTKVTMFCDLVMQTKVLETSDIEYEADPQVYRSRLTTFLNEDVFKLFAQGRFKDIGLTDT